MKRRTFLKLIGTAAILIATPVIAKTPEPQWISLSDRPPKVGQNFILSVTQDKKFVKEFPAYKNYRAIYIGKRVDPRLEIHKGTKTFMFQNYLSYTPVFKEQKFPIEDYMISICNRISIDRLKKIVKKIKWLKNVKKIRRDRSISHCIHTTDTMYWMSLIDGKCPTILPPLPKEK